MSGIHGLKVDLGVHCRGCQEPLAVIAAGSGPHAAQLRCSGCGVHRQWFPRAAIDFIEEITRSVGMPTEPILFRDRTLTIGEHTMTVQKYDDTNRGALFNAQKDKDKDTDRDYSGSLNVGGVDYWISGWVKVSSIGTKFLSLSVKPKVETKAEAEAKKPAINDQIPF
jgi:hypothetical protein